MNNYKIMNDEDFEADVGEKIGYQNSDIYKISSLFNHYEKDLEVESTAQKDIKSSASTYIR